MSKLRQATEEQMHDWRHKPQAITQVLQKFKKDLAEKLERPKDHMNMRPKASTV